jgi:hypothetical protein
MTYTKPTVERLRVVGEMFSKLSRCEASGGVWSSEKQVCLPGDQ